jgi:UDP-N-acetylglucosamine 2-epimerase
MKTTIVVSARPEAIKLVPLVKALKNEPGIEVKVRIACAAMSHASNPYGDGEAVHRVRDIPVRVS